MAWLGWALAAVLLLGVGGSAVAASLSGDRRAAGGAVPAVAVDGEGDGPAAAGFRCGWFPRVCRAARRAPVRGELTVPVPGKPGTFEQVVFARGEVTAISETSISIRSADGQVTTFALNGDTRYRRGRDQVERTDVKVGARALVSGPRSGQAITARRVHLAKDTGQQGQGGGQAPTTTT